MLLQVKKFTYNYCFDKNLNMHKVKLYKNYQYNFLIKESWILTDYKKGK